MATKTELREKLTQLQTAKTNAFKMEEAERLLLELQVHQVELEMQNQDLRETQQALEDSRDRYADLYDFAPVGYLSLTGQGIIKELNLTAATLLGKPRQRLLEYPFAPFVADAERRKFRRHLQRCQAEGWARTELTLLSKNGPSHQAQLYSTQVLDRTHGSLYRTVITDITDLKQAEAALRQSQAELEQRVHTRTAELQAANEALQQEIQRRQQEIAERKAVAEALRQSEALYHTIARNIPGGVIALVDRELRFFVADGPELATLGLTQEGVKGHTVGDVFSEKIRPLAEARYRQALAGEASSYEYHFRGRVLWTQFVPLHDESGTVVAAMSLSLDITERQRAEIALRESQTQFQTVIENLDEGLVIADLEGHLLHWNRAALAMCGFASLEECQCRLSEFADIFELAGMDGTVWPLHQWPLARILRGEHLREVEARIRRLKADWQRVHSYGGTLIRDASGAPRLAVVTISDITERKQAEAALRESEARLRTIINAVPDVLLVLDEEGRYLEILTAQPPLLSTDRTALKGQLVNDVLPAEIAQAYVTAIRQTLLTRQYQRFEYALVLEHADPRYFEARTAPLEVPLADKPAVVLLARDVTAQRLTEASLRQAQKMEAVGQLTGGMAHDFNNLLAVILGNLELLAEDLTEAALADLVHRAQGATERGAELIRRLLAFARKQPLQVKAVDLNRLVAGMRELLQRTLGETIQIETRLAVDLAQTVIDPGQLETALLNLAINARDAMPTGGRLTIETANYTLAEDDPRTQGYQVNPGPYVLLTVSDTGCGMPPVVVEHAVEPFFTTKEAGQGSGLGLSMVYGLIKQSGGHLQLYSEVGQGTALRIYLPAVPLAPDSPRTTAHLETPLPTGQGQLILVVEDETSVRRLTVHMLQSLGYQTVEAETAASALAVLATNPQVAVLFTDVVLPGGKSGMDLAQEACQQRPGLKVLFTSGYTEAHLTPFTHSLMGSNFLSKPYRKAQLANQLHALLHNEPSGGD